MRWNNGSGSGGDGVHHGVGPARRQIGQDHEVVDLTGMGRAAGRSGVWRTVGDARLDDAGPARDADHAVPALPNRGLGGAAAATRPALPLPLVRPRGTAQVALALPRAVVAAQPHQRVGVGGGLRRQ
eukprot:SAG11_NODE_750_length_7360_cov_7.329522_9_plen_127_part_00